MKRFGLGYAPDAWDGLLAAATEASISVETLEKAGLVLPRREGGGWYDRYRARLIFPILSHVGKVLGFGGRILPGQTDPGKYIKKLEEQGITLAETPAVWTCAMHPQIRVPKAGKCPICAMDLVLFKHEAVGSDPHDDHGKHAEHPH